MADITVYKTLSADKDTFKGESKSYSSRLLAYGTGATGVEALTWYMVERDPDGTWADALETDEMRNLFHSFGISREFSPSAQGTDWFGVGGVNTWYNAKRMIIATIPQDACGSYIDGSTVRLNVPTGVTTDGSYITLYGSTFEGYPDPETGMQLALEYSEAPTYGGAYCYLFHNSAGAHGWDGGSYGEHPYTGTIKGEPNPNASATSWDLDADTIMSRHLSATHWSEGDDGRDYPVGVALLDKGIFVIFDIEGANDLIASEDFSDALLTGGDGEFIWTGDSGANFKALSGTSIDDVNTDPDYRKGIYFVGVRAHETAKLTYRTVTQDYKMVYFCHAGQAEFNSTTNHTYNHKKAYYRPEEADSVWVTEIGLYDDSNELLAYAKLDRAVEKNRLETLTFKVELQL